MKQILIYIAIIITLPIVVILGGISGLWAGLHHAACAWPEQLYNMLNTTTDE